MSLNLPHRTIKRSQYLALFFVLLVIPLSQGIGQSAGNLSVNDEFPKSFEEARAQYHGTINCFISKAVQAHLIRYNQKLQRDTGLTPPLPVPENAPDCQKIQGNKIQGKLQIELDKMLQAIDDNEKKFAQNGEPPQAPTEAAQPDKMLPCNFDIAKNVFVANTSPDYFARERAETLSPTYAAGVVSNCYYAVYQSYLRQRVSNSYDPSSIESDGTVTQEQLRNEKVRRENQETEELTRAEQALNLALAGLDELVQTYPLHIRYTEIIAHSQKLRDQMRRIRVSIDQLQYKLPNQSTATCD